MKGIIPTDKTFSVGVDLHIPVLEKLKNYLFLNCENKYNFPPHVGVVMCAIDESNLQEVFDYCQNYFNNIKPFKTKLSNVIYYPNRISPGEYMVQLDVVGKELYTMHKELLTNISSNYKGNYIREKDYDRIQQGLLDDKRKEYVIKYGFSQVMDLYKPHITVASLKEKYLDAKLKSKIESDLKNIAGGSILIQNIHILYHTTPKIQTETRHIKKLFLNLEDNERF